MSASREKKQRGEGTGDLTPRQLRDLKEAQAQKRKKITYTAVGVIAAALVIALLVWDSGLFQKGQVAATVNGQDFTVAQVSYYYHNSVEYQDVMSMVNFYSQIGYSDPSLYNPAKRDSQQVQDAESGQTYADYFRDAALNTMKEIVILCDQAAEADYTVSDEGKAEVDAALDSMKTYAAQRGMSLSAYIKAQYGKYMSESTLRQEALRATLASEYQKEITDSYTYTDAQLDGYYQENAAAMDSYEYYYAQINGAAESTVDAEGKAVEPTDEAKAEAMSAAKDQAEAMAAELESGADFAETAVKYVSEADKTAYEADPEYRHQTGDLGSNLTSSYGQWVTDSARKPGDIGVVEDTAANCYYVVKMVKRWLADDTYATVDTRHVLIKAVMDEGATTPTEAQYEAAKARVEEIRAEWESGPKTADTFAQVATLYSDDADTKADGGLMTEVTRGINGGDFSSFAFAAGRKVGDVGVVQSTQTGKEGYYLVYIDGLGELYWKGTAETALRSDDYTAWFEGVSAGYEAQASAGMSHIAR